MTRESCGHRTKSGGTCNWDRADCPWHGRGGVGDVAAPPLAQRRSAPAPSDIRAFAAWAIERVVAGELTTAEAAVLASLLRVLASLGPGEADLEDALAEIELRGRLMHGLPPRDEEQWALARSRFDDDAIREFESWEGLLEAHRFNGGDPGILRQDGAVEGEVAEFIEDEDA